MTTESITSTLKFEDLMPAPIGEYGTSAGTYFDVQLPSQWSRSKFSVFHLMFPGYDETVDPNPLFSFKVADLHRMFPGYDETVDPVTISIIDDAKFFDFDHSSVVFAPDGLKRTKFQAYSVRIVELRRAAAQDGYSLSLASEFDFWCFIGQYPLWRKGNLVLMDNGNLRAVWKDDQKTHFGLQFLGGGMVQYVIFKQRESARPLSRVAGRDTFEGIKQQIWAFELHSLLYE